VHVSSHKRRGNLVRNRSQAYQRRRKKVCVIMGYKCICIIFALHRQPVEEVQIAGEYLDCFKRWIITPIKRTPL
jgi:hypothetical protein